MTPIVRAAPSPQPVDDVERMFGRRGGGDELWEPPEKIRIDASAMAGMLLLYLVRSRVNEPFNGQKSSLGYLELL